MKKTQIQTIIKGGLIAITKEVNSLKLTILNHKLKASRGETKNVRESKTLRRDIARLLTAKELL